MYNLVRLMSMKIRCDAAVDSMSCAFAAHTAPMAPACCRCRCRKWRVMFLLAIRPVPVHHDSAFQSIDQLNSRRWVASGGSGIVETLFDVAGKKTALGRRFCRDLRTHPAKSDVGSERLQGSAGSNRQILPLPVWGLRASQLLMKKSGTVEALNVSPKGFYEGFLLKTGKRVVQINFPKEEHEPSARDLKPGQQVTIEVESEQPHGKTRA